MKVFTTGQAAKICKVAARTISKWFDSGRLKGYRLPGSRDRRIPKDFLICFLKENGMPLGDLEDEDLVKVIFVSSNELRISSMKASLTIKRGFKLAVAANGFETGIQIEAFNPKILIVDFSIGNNEANQLCQSIRKNSDYSNLIVLALIQESEMRGLDRSPINEIFRYPLDQDVLTFRLEELTGKIKVPA